MVLQNKNKSLTPTKSCVDVRADLNCVLLLLRIGREVAVGENLRLANAKRVHVRPQRYCRSGEQRSSQNCGTQCCGL
uniref:Uncharacterized protein n=1 Tax=Anopheles arabiensis TaxID=7173 RepID=A0A182HRH5_ANOAR